MTKAGAETKPEKEGKKRLARSIKILLPMHNFFNKGYCQAPLFCKRQLVELIQNNQKTL